MTEQAGYLTKFFTSAKGDLVVLQLMRDGCPAGGAELTHAEALTLAAWLVAITGKHEDFSEILEAVERT